MRPLLLLSATLALIGCDKDVSDTADIGDSGVVAGDVDADADGWTVAEGDCDDSNGGIYPSAAEFCDDLDQDCDEVIDEEPVDGGTFFTDGDGDTYGDINAPQSACAAGDGLVADTTDCDDANPRINVAASEVCDGVDNDCDDLIDDADPDLDPASGNTYYEDADGDGYGTDSSETLTCEVQEGFAVEGGDCNDFDEAVYPGADEICDSYDNDCDVTVDEDATDATTWYPDVDEDNFGDAAGALVACAGPDDGVTWVADGTDCDDADRYINPAAAEVCDGEDNDCDTLVDDLDDSVDLSTTIEWARDEDGDGYGLLDDTQESCAPPKGYGAEASAGEDCDDDDYDINPGADEVCDDIDNDCDDLIDDADPDLDLTTATDWYPDLDGDDYGDDAVAAVTACDAPADYIDVAGDCDDEEATVNPGATEICDGLDNDCDGDFDDDDKSIDLSTIATWYYDEDGDGYGDEADTTEACAPPDGYALESGDCDVEDPDTYPGAPELCDGEDNNCDEVVDDEDDTDGDGYAACDGDCDDGDDTIFPDADEYCDEIDNDCDEAIDELGAVDGEVWYPDSDEDGYGGTDGAVQICEGSPPTDYIEDGSDCDDSDPNVYPGAVELCDGQRTDCDDTTWTSDAGMATWVPDSGGYTDVSADLSAGSYGAPQYYAITSDGQLRVCEAAGGSSWYVEISVQADNVHILGADGAELVVLSGGGAANVITLDQNYTQTVIEGVTITEGYGCYGPAISGLDVYSCSSTSASGSYRTGLEVEVVDSIITDNEVQLGGGVITHGWQSWMSFDNTPVYDNIGTALYAYESSMDCYGGEEDRGGFWANSSYGLYFFEVSGTNRTITSDACDFGVGHEDNGGYDVYLYGSGGSSYYDYGDDEAFECESLLGYCY